MDQPARVGSYPCPGSFESRPIRIEAYPGTTIDKLRDMSSLAKRNHDRCDPSSGHYSNEADAVLKRGDLILVLFSIRVQEEGILQLLRLSQSLSVGGIQQSGCAVVGGLRRRPESRLVFGDDGLFFRPAIGKHLSICGNSLTSIARLIETPCISQFCGQVVGIHLDDLAIKSNRLSQVRSGCGEQSRIVRGNIFERHIIGVVSKRGAFGFLSFPDLWCVRREQFLRERHGVDSSKVESYLGVAGVLRGQPFEILNEAIDRDIVNIDSAMYCASLRTEADKENRNGESDEVNLTSQ